MPKKEGDRSNFSMGFVGGNNTGKSTIAKHIARVWKKANPDCLIVAHDPQDNFGDIADYLINPEDKKWAERCCKFKNTLFILDDVRLINESNVPVSGLKNLLYFRTKRNVDIIHICHAPSEILNAFAHFTTHYYIFYTEAQEDEFKRKIPNHALVKACSKKVNDYVSIFGTGEYEKKNFPHMIIDCKTRKISAINMNNDVSKIPLHNNQVTRSTKTLLTKIQNDKYKGTGNLSYKPTGLRNKQK